MLLLYHPDLDVNKKTADGQTALSMAVRAADHSGVTPMPNNGGAIVRELLQHPDINVNSADDFGQVTLHGACLYGQTDCVVALLQHEGVQVNARNMNGISGLLMACNAGHMEVVRALLQCPQLDLGEITTARDAALEQGHMEVAALIDRPQTLLAIQDLAAGAAASGGKGAKSPGTATGAAPTEVVGGKRLRAAMPWKAKMTKSAALAVGGES